MSELVIQNSQLPANLEDLSKFILVGREKLNSVRAEIKAIDKLNLAQEVRNQKKDEAMMLSEALLDAEVRLGDLLKTIPKATRGNQYTGKMVMDSGGHNQKPKHEVVKELGFDRKQAQRFETLSDNKDLVEQVKAEARENDDIPTRTRVLDLAQQRKKREEEEAQKNTYEYLNYCEKTAKRFANTIYQASILEVNDKTLNAWREMIETKDKVFSSVADDHIRQIDEIVPKLIKIRNFLKELKG